MCAGEGDPMDVDVDCEHEETLSVPRHDIEYNMKHKNRGIALVFNHKQFNSRLELGPRNGTDEDVENFKQVLKILGFTEIFIHNDLTVDKIKDELDRVRMMDHTDNDCLLVAMFTHGNEDSVYAYDDSLFVDEIWEPFISSKCLTLVEKPKLFFIQACRGNQFDAGVQVLKKTDAVLEPYKIPNYSDVLISYSTISGFYSWRSPTQVSRYVQSLREIFHRQGQSLDLLTLLTLVNQKVAIGFESFVPYYAEKCRTKPTLCLTSMLARKKIWEPFIGSNCLTLVEKLKLFFMKACRGDRLDSGVKVIEKADALLSAYKIPNHADFLISYSTIPGFYSWRNTTEGSWYVQSLCEIFPRHGKSLDLLTLLTLVNQKVAIGFESVVPSNTQMDQKKQTSCFISLLTRKLFFRPKNIEESI